MPIGASAHPMVAFSGFYESHEAPSLGNVRGIVLPHRDGHRNSQQSWYILHSRFVDCCHGGGQGNTKRVVTRWQHPVASDEALDMLHQAMPRALLQRIRMTIKMACDGGTFARRCRYFA